MYIQQPDGSVILVSSGVPIPPGAAVQTIAAQPGQATVQGGQLQVRNNNSCAHLLVTLFPVEETRREKKKIIAHNYMT